MSFCLRPNICKKCGKPLTMFEWWICLECEKAEQEPNCPFYKIDEDGHGLCMNHRYMEDVLGKIRAEIAEYKDDKIIHDECNEMLDIVLEIIDKYKAESENNI